MKSRVNEEHNIFSFVVSLDDTFELTIQHNSCDFSGSTVLNFVISLRHFAISSCVLEISKTETTTLWQGEDFFMTSTPEALNSEDNMHLIRKKIYIKSKQIMHIDEQQSYLLKVVLFYTNYFQSL
jgi:hypothetical protein